MRRGLRCFYSGRVGVFLHLQNRYSLTIILFTSVIPSLLHGFSETMWTRNDARFCLQIRGHWICGRRRSWNPFAPGVIHPSPSAFMNNMGTIILSLGNFWRRNWLFFLVIQKERYDPLTSFRWSVSGSWARDFFLCLLLSQRFHSEKQRFF